MRLLLAPLIALAGCSFSAPDGGDTFACSAAAPECPPGTMCIDGRCTVESDAAPLPPTGFGFRQKLTFDNRGRGTVAGFPVLVALEPGVFTYGDAAGDGSDLRFFDPDDTPLPVEVESWNPSGRSLLWVVVPEVTGNSDLDFIWLYYGHAAPPAPPGGDVWSTYQAVYHLTAGADDAAGAMIDGTLTGTEPVAGRIADGRRFDGVDDHIEIGPAPPLLRAVPGATLEAWVKPAPPAGDADQVVLAVSAHEAALSRAQIKLDPARDVKVVFRTVDAQEPSAPYVDDKPLSTGEWTWVVAVADFAAGTVRVFLNGAEGGELMTAAFADATPDTAPDRGLIGIDETGVELFTGDIDEVRIAGAALSGDWLAAQYASMTGALVGFEPAEAL